MEHTENELSEVPRMRKPPRNIVALALNVSALEGEVARLRSALKLIRDSTADADEMRAIARLTVGEREALAGLKAGQVPLDELPRTHSVRDVRTLRPCTGCAGVGNSDAMIEHGASWFHGRCFIAHVGEKAFFALPPGQTERMMLGDVGMDIMKRLIDRKRSRATERELPPLVPRRPLNDEEPDGLMESDRDFVENNLELAVALLDALSDENRGTP